MYLQSWTKVLRHFASLVQHFPCATYFDDFTSPLPSIQYIIMHLSMSSPRRGDPRHTCMWGIAFSEEFLVKILTLGPEKWVKWNQISPPWANNILLSIAVLYILWITSFVIVYSLANNMNKSCISSFTKFQFLFHGNIILLIAISGTRKVVVLLVENKCLPSKQPYSSSRHESFPRWPPQAHVRPYPWAQTLSQIPEGGDGNRGQMSSSLRRRKAKLPGNIQCSQQAAAALHDSCIKAK